MGSVVAFFLGNPTLNPAVLVFLVLTLGWQWALLRLVVGVGLVFGSVFLTSRVSLELQGATTAAPPVSDYDSLPVRSGTWYLRWIRSFGRLAVWLLPEYIILVGALGAARAFLFPVISPGFGNDPLVMVGFAIAGMLFAIPTAGEIPIIQTLRLSGLGAGPAGALLLTLAPISLPSLVMVARVLPIRVLLLLAGATVIAGIGAGVLAVVLGL